MEVTSNRKETRQATWIWYPGDFEIWLGNRMNNRRTERGTFFPPFWKQDSHYVTVEFSTALNLSQADRVQVFAEGKYNVKLDGKLLFGMPREVDMPRASIISTSRCGIRPRRPRSLCKAARWLLTAHGALRTKTKNG